MNDSQVAELLRQFFNGSISASDKERLTLWIEEHGHTGRFEELMKQSWHQFQPMQSVENEKANRWLRNILTDRSSTPVISMAPRSRRVTRWVAAVIALCVGAGLFYFTFSGNRSPAPLVQTVEHDVAPPASSLAVLRTAGGRQIILDSAASGSLAVHGAATAIKLEDGTIAYSPSAGNSPMQYDTLFVPAGSRITTIMLSDGTEATLNAASSIAYPVAFGNKERKVKITGEVYFEVSKSKTPFVVETKGNDRVEVLGTHFNVNAFEENPTVKITLLEGKVKVGKIILEPGQQAVVNASRQLSVENDVDIEQVMAWKNGMFLYRGSDIKSIMQDVARTYNVKINYEAVSTERFYAEVPRSTNMSRLLKMLELTGEVHFHVKDKEVTVTK